MKYFWLFLLALLSACGGGGGSSSDSGGSDATSQNLIITPVTGNLNMSLAFDRNGNLLGLESNRLVQKSAIQWVVFSSDSVGHDGPSHEKQSGDAIRSDGSVNIPTPMETDRGVPSVILTDGTSEKFDLNRITCPKDACKIVTTDSGERLLQYGDFKGMSVDMSGGRIVITWDTKDVLWGFFNSTGSLPRTYMASDIQLIRWRSGNDSTAVGAISRTREGKLQVIITYGPEPGEQGIFTAELAAGGTVEMNTSNRGITCNGCVLEPEKNALAALAKAG